MQPQKCIACGIDIYKDLFVAAIITRDGSVTIERFDHTQDGLLALKSWILTAGCPVVAMESAGNYWRPHISCLKDIWNSFLQTHALSSESLGMKPILSMRNG